MRVPDFPAQFDCCAQRIVMDENMSSCRFSIAYTGEALEDGSMSAKDLAASLLAAGELFDAVNDTLNHGAAKVEIRVKAVSRGSFEIDLEVVQSLYRGVVNVFSGDTVTAALQMKEFLFAGGLGLFSLIKLLRGRKVRKAEDVEAGTIKLTLDDETLMEINTKLWELRENPKVMRSIRTLVEPLEQEGIDGFEVRSGGRVEASVNEAEADYFDASVEDESILTDDIREVAYTIVTVNFKPQNKWRLNDGSSTINAVIEDEEFLEKVAARKESFANGDVLLCEVRIRQVSDGEGGIRTTHTIQRVLEHRHSPETRQLFTQ